MKKIIITILLLSIIPVQNLHSEKYIIAGKIISIKKKNIAVVKTDIPLLEEEYNVLSGETVISTVKIIGPSPEMNNNSAKDVVQYFYLCRLSNSSAKAGMSIVFVKMEKDYKPDYADKMGKDVSSHPQEIFTKPLNTVMVLVPGGKSYIGSNDGEPDEFPRQLILLDDFYIDKFEVSNKDFLIYVEESNANPPKSWINGEFPQKLADYPVQVSYYEAESFASWAGKRLPTELEWEKAANGTGSAQKVYTNEGMTEIVQKTEYPWGNNFISEICNSSDYWDLPVNSSTKKGLLPVKSLKEKNVSAYGAVNMSGNIAEWTNSWYDSYSGNASLKNKRFGTMVKVVKGGGYYSTSSDVRIANREYGGIPNLNDDNAFGFRCVSTPVKLPK